MPHNWKTYKLGEIADVQNGYAFKANELVGEGIPVVKIKNIISPNVTIEDVSYFNGNLTTQLEKYIAKQGDFLISMTGSTVNVMSSAVGKMGRYRLNDVSLINQRVGKIYVTVPDVVSFDYLCQYLNRYEIHYNLALNATGSANQANISPAQIKNIDILLPSLEEQQAIASILSSIDDKIENNLAINKTLEEMAMALYKHWFVDFGPFQDGEFVESELGMIPKGWAVSKLDEFANILNAQRVPLSSNQRSKRKGEYPYYGASGIIDYIDDFIFNGEYVLISEDGENLRSRNTPIAFIAFDKFWVNNHAHIIEGNKKGLNELIICHFAQLDMNHYLTGAVQPKLNKQNLLSIGFAMPKDMTSITKVLGELDFYSQLRLLNIKENQTLAQLRDTLLPKLISGEVRLKEFQEQLVTIL
jgi:type I restriction enzyme S subunit